MDRPRLSEILKDFVETMKSADPAVVQAVHKAISEGLTEVKTDLRKVGGAVIKRYEVNLSDLRGAAGPTFGVDARALEKAVSDEVKARGDDWGMEGLHLAVRDLLLKPLAALLPAPAPAAASTPAPAEAS